ncbi:pleckstrin homology domain-containing family S member 1-like isoform X2 [Heptranchias perlo]|uniref:pleckstrin homology domain-containing family S member 1-like isoform X2 n=1 Tax=Heptranchias perlo TaxID=212740 RepID=UPI00355A8506
MNKRGSLFASVFYSRENDTENDICYEGYFTKSPPAKQFTTQSSWKKRYFVLEKKKDEHILNYYKNQEESRRSPPLGEIPIKRIKELCIRPEYHAKWSTLQRMFKCASESVILLKTEERDYFFIGEKMSVEIFQAIIASLLQMETIPQSEEQTQDSFGELVNTEPHLQPETSSPNQSNVIYATIPEILAVENNKRKSEEFNPEPHVEPARPEMTEHIYDVPRNVLMRMSELNLYPVNTEKQRSCSLPAAEIKHYSATYDTPMNITSAMCRSEKTVSADSGVYMSMASLNRASTNSSIDCFTSSEQINEENESSTTKSGILVDVQNQHRPLQSPHEHSLGEKFGAIWAKSEPLTYWQLKTLHSNITKETKLEKLDIIVHREDIKNNLLLQQVNDKVCVAYSKMCVFHHGDQIVAINKLQVNDVKEIGVFINKSIEKEVVICIEHNQRVMVTSEVGIDQVESSSNNSSVFVFIICCVYFSPSCYRSLPTDVEELSKG